MTPPATTAPPASSRLTCGALRHEDAGAQVTLQGWVHRRRDLGGLIFIDLRDRFGLTQIVFNPQIHPDVHALASDLRNEYVLRVSGVVRERPEGTINPRLPTGEIEVEVETLDVLNVAKTPPFEINQDGEVDESVRLKHRYLDLRRSRMAHNIVLRHQMTNAMRQFLLERDFLEIETPLLIKSTPEGARDFLVPSSVFPGNFYALPQSPQQLKQLLMVAGFDRYFQIARCFRDEAQRADRQPEFTQLDIEMSFIVQNDIMSMMEELFITLTSELSEKRIQSIPFPRITYAESMRRFGNDRPDLRFGVELNDLSDALRTTGFQAFAQTLANGGQVKAIVAPGCAGYTRRELDELTEFAKRSGAKGLATLSVRDDEVRGPIAKFLAPEELAAMTTGIGAAPGDLVLAVADSPSVVAKTLASLREEIGRRLNLADPGVFAFCWIYEFPMLEFNEDEKRWKATHNPFSGFLPEDEPLLDTNPSAVRAKQYDLTCNGFELGGGSIRNHRRADQERLFGMMGYPPEEVIPRFGALLDSLDYGAPPHGGIAMGIDRFAMLLADASNIREVIAFPKNQRGLDLMFGSPDRVDAVQLEELGLALVPEKAEVTSS